jgi:hypothetical protein
MLLLHATVAVFWKLFDVMIIDLNVGKHLHESVSRRVRLEGSDDSMISHGGLNCIQLICTLAYALGCVTCGQIHKHALLPGDRFPLGESIGKETGSTTKQLGHLRPLQIVGNKRSDGCSAALRQRLDLVLWVF